MNKTFIELLGTLIGHFLGLFAWVISALRNARMFHPRGVVYKAEVENLVPEILKFHSHALIRLSGGLWKNLVFPDALGIAIRFSPQEVKSTGVKEDDQDMLFVTFDRIWKMFFSPFITDYSDFLQNDYFSITPFCTVNWEKAYFKLVASHDEEVGINREIKLSEAVKRNKAWFLLKGKASKTEDWTVLAKIRLTVASHLDQEALRFSPFHSGLGIHPIGFLNHLRIGTYKLSQKARPHQVVPLNLPRPGIERPSP